MVSFVLIQCSPLCGFHQFKSTLQGCQSLHKPSRFVSFYVSSQFSCAQLLFHPCLQEPLSFFCQVTCGHWHQPHWTQPTARSTSQFPLWLIHRAVLTYLNFWSVFQLSGLAECPPPTVYCASASPGLWDCWGGKDNSQCNAVSLSTWNFTPSAPRFTWLQEGQTLHVKTFKNFQDLYRLFTTYISLIYTGGEKHNSS